MADESQSTATPVSEVPEPTAIPDVIDEQTFNELVGNTQPAPEPTSETEVNDAPSPEPDAAPDPRLSQLEQQNQQLQQMVTTMLAQNGNGAQNQNQPQPPSMEERLKAKFPDADPAQLTPLAELMQEIADERLAPAKQALQHMQGSLNQRQQAEIRSDFNQFMDTEMDGLKVDNSVVRKMLRDSVVQDGIETHGQGFTKEHAANLLRSKHGEYLRSVHAREEALTEKEIADSETTAPIRTSQSTTSAAEGLRKRLTDPSDKKMDLRGSDFQKLVGAFVDRMTG